MSMMIGLNLALTGVAPGGGGGGPAPATENILVANRTSWPMTLISVPSLQGYAREHYASPEGQISALKFVDVGWYLADTMTITSASAGTISKFVEYPAGVYTPVTWSGVSSVSLAGNGLVQSDATAINIPAGAKFWEHTIRVSGGAGNMALIELPANSSTLGLTDTTYVYSGSGDPVRPAANAGAEHLGSIAIIGTVAKNGASAFVIIGDSIAWGQQDIQSVGAFGDSGAVPRGIGPRYPYTKLTKPGMTGVEMAALSANAQLVALLAVIVPATTDIINEFGGGDLRVGETKAAVLAAAQTIYSYFPSALIGQQTVCPRTDSTDGYATVVNQTAKTDGNWIEEVPLNTDIRVPPANVDYVIDMSTKVSSGVDSRKWATPPIPVPDGVHMNSYKAADAGEFVYRHLLGRPAIVPNAVGSLAFAGIGGTTLGFSFVKPTIGSDTITYLVEYKRTIDSGWTEFSSGTSDLSGTITGLTVNTGYDLRVTPSNSGGSGSATTIQTTTAATFQPLDLGANLGYAWDTNDTTKVLETAGALTQMGELYTSNVLNFGGVPAVITNGGQTGNKRVIDFPAGAYLKGNGFSGLLNIPDGSTATSQFTIVEAAKLQAGVTNRLSFFGTAGSSTLAGFAIRTTTTNRGASVIEVNSRAAVTAFQAVVETSNYHVFTTIKNGTSVIFRVDGTQVASGTLVGDGSWNFNDFYIGTTSGATTPGTPATVFPPDAYSGIVVARTALAGTDLTNIEAWVGATAGL